MNKNGRIKNRKREETNKKKGTKGEKSREKTEDEREEYKARKKKEKEILSSDFVRVHKRMRGRLKWFGKNDSQRCLRMRVIGRNFVYMYYLDVCTFPG